MQLGVRAAMATEAARVRFRVRAGCGRHGGWDGHGVRGRGSRFRRFMGFPLVLPRERGGGEVVNVGDSESPMAESASSSRSCTWTPIDGVAFAVAGVVAIEGTAAGEPAEGDTPADVSSGKRSAVLIIGGSPSVSRSSSMALVAGRLASARWENPGRLVFDAEEALRVLERPRDANQLPVLDGEVEGGVERGALGPEGVGCDCVRCGSVDEAEFVGGTDTGEGADEEDGDAVRPASIPTLSSALRLRPSHNPRRRRGRCERRGRRARCQGGGFARWVLLRLAARTARDLGL
ncbi:hypothetical protein DFP72DRAFT_894710 [Ephemerocybe angulata]|uniref:Uncharacterized protein n=1 Tax=Ephemerocybe angulata TaxID=980116 RepID=A0A8H6HZX1_9AGAR|nr:hypothetical protein DFP72DRAFT_894710 [Tulosesus angulatus]